jgi:Leucine-rich repeat (LRR) protein
MKNLAYLDLRANKLTALPAGIADLMHLEKLDLRWNKLSSLPEWVQLLEQRGCTVFK